MPVHFNRESHVGIVESTDSETRRALPVTPKMIQVLNLAFKGLSNQQIAMIMGISTATVRHHYSDIFARWGVHNKTEAIYMGLERGLIGHEFVSRKVKTALEGLASQIGRGILDV